MEEICMPVETSVTRKRRSPRMMSGILLGGLIGAGIALLSAPYSGQEARDRIKGKGNEIKTKLINTTQETGERVKDMARRSSDMVVELKSMGQDKIEEQKTNVQSTVEGIRTGVRTYKEEGGLHITRHPKDIELSTDIHSTTITGPDIEEGAV